MKFYHIIFLFSFCATCPNSSIIPNVPTEGHLLCGKSYGRLNSPLCSRLSQSIVNGRDAAPGAWPWQLFMYYDDTPICGAILIYPNIALTAAHCLDERDDDKFYVTGGFNNFLDELQNPGKFWGTKISAMNHPDYKKETFDSDIAILYLHTPAKLSQELNTVCLPEEGEMAPEGDSCFATGWGLIDSATNETTTHLQETCLPLIYPDTCRPLHFKEITPNMICAGLTYSTTCSGDSGGPLVCKKDDVWKLFGISSWITTCNVSQLFSPPVFVNMPNFVHWVKYMIQEIDSP